VKVLGVSYGYHDASACLVIDGRVAAAVAEERFTRQKHDANYPAFAIAHCLESAGLSVDDVDRVVFHEDPHAKFSRVLCAALAPYPRSRREFVNSMKAWLGRKLWSLGTLSGRLGVPASKVSYLSHHFSHAVQAFMGSGQREAAILVVDAVGDWGCSALYRGEWKEGVPVIERVLEIAYPNSLGLVYSAFTAYLGFSPNDSECSTMALAAFGTPRYADQVRAIVRSAPDTAYEVDQRYFHFADFYEGPVSARFLETFGPPRDHRDRLPFACLPDASTPVSADAQRFADVAASLQLVLEERLLELAQRLHREVPSEHLCYAGGVSLNCVANQRLLREGPFRTVYVPPDPGDGGTCVGAALYACALESAKSAPETSYGAYLGPSYDVREDVAMMAHVDPEHVRRYVKRGVDRSAGSRFEQRTFEDTASLVDDVADRLMAGKIVGWYQGRAELGPRALGNRSIVIRPDDAQLAARLSRHVKDRASFRPYALSVRAESAGDVLDLGAIAASQYRWMQFAAPVHEAVRSKVIAGLHVDGTTRPQICSADENPAWHALITAFGERFGVGAVLNTSFNAAGYPIVSTPAEALAMFARTDMDVLVLDRTVVWREAS
jgi:carbamoyltransferase